MLDHHDNRQDIIQARIDLAAAFRMAARLEMHEGVCNHFSMMLPGRRFLINPKGVHFARITASSIILMDEDGNTLEGTGRPPKTGTRSTPASTCATHRRGSCCISSCTLFHGHHRARAWPSRNVPSERRPLLRRDRL